MNKFLIITIICCVIYYYVNKKNNKSTTIPLLPEQVVPEPFVFPEQVVPEQIVPEPFVFPEQVVPEQVVPEQVVPEQVVPERIVSSVNGNVVSIAVTIFDQNLVIEFTKDDFNVIGISNEFCLQILPQISQGNPVTMSNLYDCILKIGTHIVRELKNPLQFEDNEIIEGNLPEDVAKWYQEQVNEQNRIKQEEINNQKSEEIITQEITEEETLKSTIYDDGKISIAIPVGNEIMFMDFNGFSFTVIGVSTDFCKYLLPKLSPEGTEITIKSVYDCIQKVGNHVFSELKALKVKEEFISYGNLPEDVEQWYQDQLNAEKVTVEESLEIINEEL